MKINRVWAMPNKHTFLIKPIAELLKEELGKGLWVDPFSGEYSPATITNDLNPSIEADYHLDALEFLKKIKVADGVLFDPPYSPRQITECYQSIGKSPSMQDTQASFWADLKIEISRIIKIGGKCITFGWNSGGVGKSNGFEITRILLVPHGGWHNDTICTVERKISSKLWRRSQ